MSATIPQNSGNRAPAGQDTLPVSSSFLDLPLREIRLRQEYDRLTLATERTLYHPESWIERAKFFLGKYNELACVDAVKAHILCDKHIRTKLPAQLPAVDIPALSETDIESYRQTSCWIIYLALRELGAVEEASDYFNRFDSSMLAAENIPHGVDTTRWATKSKPALSRHKYPWLPADLLERKFPRGASTWLPERNVRVGPASFASKGDTVLGMFTTSQRKKDATIFVDSVDKADLKQKRLRAKETKVMTLLHHVVEYSAGYSHAQPQKRIDLLRASSFAGLTIDWNAAPDKFSFLHQIKNIALVLLRHNVLYTPTFDFWKIFHVYWKFCTNSFSHKYKDPTTGGRKEIVGFAKYYSYLNHSCDPNVIWTPDFDSAEKQSTTSEIEWTMTVNATVDIGAEEELFISYISEDKLALPVAQRAPLLQPWLGHDCTCNRCERERPKLVEDDAVSVASTNSSEKRRLEDLDNSDPNDKSFDPRKRRRKNR